MTSDRTHPFELLFGGFRTERFPAIRAALGDEADVNGFMLAAPALELMRELRPDEGLGDGVDDFVALVHAAYLFWRDGEVTVQLEEDSTRRLPHPERSEGQMWSRLIETRYYQIAPHIIWGQLDTDAPFEPLDGWFATPMDETTVRMVACFGVHALRPGVSVVALLGPSPTIERRLDGTPLFAPTMPGGDAAHLHAVSESDEILLLGWRAMSDKGA